jgi:predicted Na+-dependent transporter
MPPVTAQLVAATLFTIMFALGLGLRAEALATVRDRPALVARVLVGSCLLVPLAAVLLLKFSMGFSLSPSARYGIALMALCPSAPLTLRKAGKAGGDAQLAAALQVCAAIAAIVSVPLMASGFRAVFGIEGWTILPRDVAAQVGQAQVLPLMLGLLLRRFQPQWADRLNRPLNALANALLLVLIVAVLVKLGPKLLPFVGGEGVALVFMGVMVGIALAIGFVMAGPRRRERITISLVTSMRNPGLALLFATTYGEALPNVKLAILVYLLLTVLLSAPLLKWLRRLEST